ncbi:Uncharacterized protein APZ42_014256 [Daphnia magna]|uniref:Secreted protein n=1 Tax=Daphnia magna TaxID=35525 RepID=A0A162Q5D7_9CRUS|nr:Uncharacterized protein APZ42_014256 [Daphnia magna]
MVLSRIIWRSLFSIPFLLLNVTPPLPSKCTCTKNNLCAHVSFSWSLDLIRNGSHTSNTGVFAAYCSSHVSPSITCLFAA